jgi:hypothetical protein
MGTAIYVVAAIGAFWVGMITSVAIGRSIKQRKEVHKRAGHADEA